MLQQSGRTGPPGPGGPPTALGRIPNRQGLQKCWKQGNAKYLLEGDQNCHKTTEVYQGARARSSVPTIRFRGRMSPSLDKNARVKFLSCVLRHNPESIDLALDDQGWANVSELLEKANQHGQPLTQSILEYIVAKNATQKFGFNDDGSKIRANHGHTIAIDLGLSPLQPPAKLYHGTATRFIQSIMSEGLHPGRRTHVHLSTDRETAVHVGNRHGKPVVLEVASQQMFLDGCLFFQSVNGVWLTREVDKKYLSLSDS